MLNPLEAQLRKQSSGVCHLVSDSAGQELGPQARGSWWAALSPFLWLYLIVL